MRRYILAVALSALACGGLAGAADAGVRVKTSKTTYAISGSSGEALLAAMQRGVPQNGLMAKDLARTDFDISDAIVWSRENGACRAMAMNVALSVTYTYPRLDGGVSAGLRKRWARFMTGVVRHEETHGRIYREMAAAAERAIVGLVMENDPDCHKAKLEAHRRQLANRAVYFARQAAFDGKEHRRGGNIDGLKALLTGN